VDDLDELLSGLGTRIAARCGGVNDMVADVVFNHLRDESLERASTGRDLLQNRSTIGLHFHCALNGLELPACAPDPGQKLLLFRLGV
jgi:hypothetical protein